MAQTPLIRRSHAFLKQIASESVNQLIQWSARHPLEDWQSEIYRAALDKERDLVRPPASIYILEKALALTLEPKVRSLYPPELVSYQKGKSQLDILQGLKEYARAHPGTVYVLRRDIASYTDSIPLGESSRLWQWLAGARCSEHEIELMKKLLRPSLHWRGSEVPFCRFQGVSTGSALTPIVANLYLLDLDRALTQLSGGFYRRYGDDIVFAHADRAQALAAAHAISGILGALCLQEKTEKSKNILWTLKGGRSTEGIFQEQDSVELLGLRLTRKGIRLPPAKMKILLKRFRYRIHQSLREHADSPLELRAKIACQAARMQFSRDGVGQHPYYRLMTLLVDDPGQWKELDQEVFRTISYAVTQKPFPFSARELPPRALVKKFGLKTPGHLQQKYVRHSFVSK